MVRYLRTSAIGWGRQRYFTVLENDLAKLESELEINVESEDGNRVIYIQQKKESLQGLKSFLALVFASLPELDVEGCLPYGSLAGWLYDLINGFAVVFNAADGEAKKGLCEELELLKDSFSDNLKPEEDWVLFSTG